jgi:hypothetical protein
MHKRAAQKIMHLQKLFMRLHNEMERQTQNRLQSDRARIQEMSLPRLKRACRPQFPNSFSFGKITVALGLPVGMH